MKIQRLDTRAQLPVRSTEGSAGYDLRALLDEPLTIAPGERVSVPTGIAIALPNRETVGLIFARSGLAIKHGLALSNGVGVIDSDYTGELRVGLCNLSNTAYTLQPGERMAQLVIVPVLLPDWEEVASLTPTERGTGGFGSTGTM